MANLINIYAETDADIIGDDSTPTLALKNTSTGQALDLRSASTTNPVLTVRRTATGNISIAPLRVSGGSLASGAVLEFVEKGFASITSVVLTTVANTDYAIRVQVGLETRWIPLFKDAALVGTAAF